jgi:hypothetical protein
MAANRLAICLSSPVWHKCNVSSANGSLQIAKTLAKQKIKKIFKNIKQLVNVTEPTENQF